MCGDETLVRVRRRHPDVEDRHVGPVKTHRCQRLDSVARLGDDLAADLPEDADDAGSGEERIVGDDYAHGRHEFQTLAASSARSTGRAEAIKDVLGDLADAVREHAHGVSFPADRDPRYPVPIRRDAVTMA